MTTLAELDEISDAVHDEDFVIDELTLDAGKAEVRLPIYAVRWKRRLFWWSAQRPEIPRSPMAMLVVRNVTDVAVEDEAEIGTYSINRIVYDAAAGELRIASNVPCEVVMRCGPLDVELVR